MLCHATERKTCRLCGHPLPVDDVLNLGALCVNAFPKPDEPDTPKAPLELVLCQKCTLFQLRHTVNPDTLYRDVFWYRSGVTRTMQDALLDLKIDCCNHVALAPDDVVVDVGSNDSTLLKYYRGDLVRVGFEPARNLMRAATLGARDLIIVNDYFSAEAYHARMGQRPAKLITAAAMFYDLDDPVRFVRDVRGVLHDDGVFCVQVAYLPETLRTNDFGNVCLPPDSPVSTADGLKLIGEVADGDLVLTHRGRYRPVKATMRRDFRGELVELRAYGFGHTLRVTPEHHVLVMKNHGHEWVKARDVRRGDVVCRPVLDQTEDLTEILTDGADARRVPINEDFMAVAGWYLAEGSLSPTNLVFYFGLSDEEKKLAGRCRDAVTRLGFSARIDARTTSTAVSAPVALGRALAAFLGRGAEGKRISPRLLKLPVGKLRVLLYAYMEGDGYSCRRRRYLRASTVSENLAYDVALLANRLGMKCSICKQARPAVCEIEGRVVTQLPLWDVLVHRAPEKRMKVWMEDGYQCGRVRHVGLIPYSGVVCNLEVEEDNTYVSPAMTVHNCHEHLTYLTVRTVGSILAAGGLYPWDCSFNATNGGSVRVFAGLKARAPSPAYYKALEEEEATGLVEPGRYLDPYTDFAVRVRKLRDDVRDAVAEAAGKGPVHALGASTKGNTMLQYWGPLGDVIKAASDRDPAKHGRVTVGTRIPIVSEEESRRTAKTYLVLPWYFRAEMVAREVKWLSAGPDRTLLFPSPSLQVVRAEL